LLRGYQIATRARLSKDVDFLLNDLDSLLELAGRPDSIGIVGACTIVTIYLFQVDPLRVLKYAVRAIKNADDIVLPDGKSVVIPDGKSLELLLVAVGSAAKTDTQIEGWLSALDELAPNHLRRMFDTESASELCCTICNGVWLRESDHTEPDWQGAMRELGRIENQARRLGIELLRIAAIRAQIIVEADYNRKLDVAVNLAKTALATSKENPKAEFLINEVLGHQYLYAQRFDDALEYLDRAARADVRSFPFLRMRCLLAAAQSSSHKNRLAAVEYCTRAAELARSEKGIPKQQVVVAFAEKAIACWYAGDRVAAFLNYEEVVRRLFECRSDNSKWRELFGLCGHVLGYFCSMSSTGNPPGAEFEYTVPQQGWFLVDRPRIAEMYDAQRDWSLAGQLTILAEALGLDEDACKWALEAVRIGRERNRPPAAESLLIYAVTQEILQERYGQALELALSSTLSMRIARIRSEGGNDAALDVAEYKQAEYVATIAGFLPIVFGLAKAWLSDPEKAHQSSMSLAESCRKIATSAARPDLWESAAKILEQSFQNDVRWQQLYEEGKAFSKRGDTSLQVICHLVSSLHAPPSTSFRLHASVLPYIEKQMSHYGMYRRIVLPFFRDFWLRSVEVDAFYYGTPSVLRGQLLLSARDLTKDKLKDFFQMIERGLGLTSNAEVG
jgi:tetratricopeptide (TPR) repeat protein